MWRWSNGQAQILSPKQGKHKLRLINWSTNKKEVLERKDVHIAHKTLGTRTSPSGQSIMEKKFRTKQISEWAHHIKCLHLHAHVTWTAFNGMLLKEVGYTLPVTGFTEAMCTTMLKPMMSALLPKLHINRHFPHQVTHAPK